MGRHEVLQRLRPQRIPQRRHAQPCGQNTELIARGDTIRLFKSHKDGYADGAQLRDFVYVKTVPRSCSGSWTILVPQASSTWEQGKLARLWTSCKAIGKALNKPVNIEFVDMPESIRPNYQYFHGSPHAQASCGGHDSRVSQPEEGVADYVRQYLVCADAYR